VKISTIVPTIFRPAGLAEVVDSILKQTRIPDELIIVDQSPDDRSKNVVNEIFAGRRERPNLVYVHDSSFQSLVHAKEVGVRNSSGDVVSFLEDDVVLSPDYLQEMEVEFLKNPAMKGCSGIIPDSPLWTDFYRFFFHLFHRGLFYDPRGNFHNKNNVDGRVMHESNYLSGGISAYKKEVFEKVEFDRLNDFHMFEDVDFSTRAAKIFGKENFFVHTGMHLEHKMSPINRPSLRPRWRRKLRETLCFFKKNQDRSFSLVCLLWLLIGACLESLVSAVRLNNAGPVTGAARGVVDGIFYQLSEVRVEDRLSLDSLTSPGRISDCDAISTRSLKILFVHNGKAFLPELGAYVKYLRGRNQHVELTMDESAMIPPGEYDLVYRFAGLIRKIRGANAPEIHEFNSASTPRWSKAKNTIKSLVIPRPVARVFLNEFVKSQFDFLYEAPFMYRDMGVDVSVFSCRKKNHKIYDVVYAGSVTGRPGFIDVVEKLSRGGITVGIAGHALDWEAHHLASLRGVDFLGTLEFESIAEFLSSGIFGLNYCPDIYPYSKQTSTKVIEYLAGGLPIISNRYEWINAHSSVYGYSFLDVSEVFSAKDLIQESGMVVDEDLAMGFEWGRILDESNFLNFLQKSATQALRV
jgi:glycosyltransferase involved in cell wall biosynthesis